MRHICINQKCKSDKVAFVQNTHSGHYFHCQTCGRSRGASEWVLKEELHRIVLEVESGLISAQTAIEKIKEVNKK